jgi:uncharacterized protein (DUF1810 family)
MGDYVEAPTIIKAGEEGLHHEIVGDVPKTCVCDTKTLLAHIAEDGKTFQAVIDEMQKAIEDDKKLKAQLLANEVI